MVVFDIPSTVKGAFGDDVSFPFVTKMACILNAFPPFASILPSEPPCIPLFALVLLSECFQMIVSRLFPFDHGHRARFHALGDAAHPDTTIAPLVK
jgi:hypothetical protein